MARGNGSRTLTQPVKWHGGKHYLSRWIIGLMPPHLHYVEPYFGGGSVLLDRDPGRDWMGGGAEPQPSYLRGGSEVVNDINRHLSNFWMVLKSEEHFGRFMRVVEATPFSQAEWDAARSEPVGEIDVEAAVRFFVRARQSRQGLMKDFATLSRNRTRRGMNEQVSAWLTAVDGLPAVHSRLKRVVILNDDALGVIRRQDGPLTLFYCDPPYLHEARSATDAYEHEMTGEQHMALLECLAGIEGKFMLSGYHSAMYDEFAEMRGWRCEEYEIDNKASASKSKEKKIECLWLNYSPGEGCPGPLPFLANRIGRES